MSESDPLPAAASSTPVPSTPILPPPNPSSPPPPPPAAPPPPPAAPPPPPAAPPPPQGAVLTNKEILTRIEAGEIFHEDTYDRRNIRGASYNIRIATDMLRIGEDIYDRGEHRRRPFVLNPGDVAFVTSAEEFRLPWDIVGNIGIRFRFVNSGLLVHTGLLIAPGYGFGGAPEVLSDRKRLHFLIANVGGRPEIISPGVDSIVSVQFIRVLGELDPRVSTEGQDELEDLYLRRKEPLGLSFFKHIQSIEDIEQRLAKVEVSNINLILFGVFIVAAAFLGVVLTQVLSFLNDPNATRRVANNIHILRLTWPEVTMLVFIGLFVTYWLQVLLAKSGSGTLWVFGAIRRLWRSRPYRRPILRRLRRIREWLRALKER